jgi:hypothetical protein
MAEPTIICPKCKNEIKLTESLAAPLIESTRLDFERRLAQKDLDVAGREKSIQETVPFLRNTLAGHGQGQKVVIVSRELAELCLHLSGALILYCIRRQLILNPPPPAPTNALSAAVGDDDVPF